MRSAVSPSPTRPAATGQREPSSRWRSTGAKRTGAWGRRRVLAGLPLDVALACASGLGIGAASVTIAYVSYFHAGGPTGAGIAAIPVSLLIVALAYWRLARRRRHASDWLGLGYTVAVVLAIGFVMLWQILRGFYAELTAVAW